MSLVVFSCRRLRPVRRFRNYPPRSVLHRTRIDPKLGIDRDGNYNYISWLLNLCDFGVQMGCPPVGNIRI